MARYPAFEDYEKRGNYVDGIKRCDELLGKKPKDIQLLATKYRLLYAIESDAAQSVLDEIVPIATSDLQQIIAIEDAVIDSQSNLWPRLPTAGPSVAKIWENAAKAAGSLNHKLETVSVRFERAVLDSRLVDAQQALIQLKAIQPKNRVVYMAHAAFTQLISRSNDDLQARLALGLARKAVAERFDDDRALDTRVSGQIFALQQSERDLGSIKGRSFEESKHVFDARRQTSQQDSNGTREPPHVPDAASVNATEWLTAEISALKHRFSNLGGNAQAETVRGFAANAIRLYRTSTNISGARRSPADACFLAISALVKLFELQEGSEYLLQAAFLAESLLQHNEHIHEARLILVYIYMRLALGSLAMRLFESLSVKEVQHDTISHVLFTRISLIHPHATLWSKKEGVDPLKRTSHALRVYDRCENKLAETEASVLSNGQTGMIFDLQDLRDNLRGSLARRLTLMEHRRVERLMKGRLSDDDGFVRAMGPRVCQNWIETKDNRDFDAAFDYGYNIERALYRRGDSVPGNSWLLFGLAADTAWCLATETSAVVIDPRELLRQLDELRRESDSGMLPNKLGMSAAELITGDVACALLTMLLHVRDGELQSHDQVSKAVEIFQRLNIDLLIEEPDPLAERLMDHYLYADVTRIATSACNFSSKRCPEDLHEPLRQLQDLAKRSLRLLQQHATEQQARMNASAVRKQFSQDESIAKELQSASSAQILDEFCERVAKSAKEGWEGLMKLQVI